MATIQTAADWQKQWFEIADATYLNTAAHAAMPRVSLQRGTSLARSEAVSPSHKRLRLVRDAKPNSGFLIENDWGETRRNRTDHRRKHWRRGRGTWPDMEAGRRDHHR